MDCKYFIQQFNKSGGKLVCNYDTKTCQLTQNKTNVKFKMNKDCFHDIDKTFSIFFYQYNNYVTQIPDMKKREKLHYFQESNSKGFIIEFARDEDNFFVQTKKI
jgi:hypothetical protein